MTSYKLNTRLNNEDIRQNKKYSVHQFLFACEKCSRIYSYHFIISLLQIKKKHLQQLKSEIQNMTYGIYIPDI